MASESCVPSSLGNQSEYRSPSSSASFALLKPCCRHLAYQRLLTSEHAAKELLFPASRLITASISSWDLSSMSVKDMVGTSTK